MSSAFQISFSSSNTFIFANLSYMCSVNLFRTPPIFNFFLSLDPSATGYVVDISPVKQSRDGKRKYFDFKLQGQGMEQRAVCFSPEKFKLLSTISKESAGCEVKKFKRGNCNEILINDFSSVRKIDVLFDKTNIPKTFTNIAKINNECGMYEIVNLKAYLYNLALEESASKFGKPIKFRQASLKDSTDSIAVTVFGDLADKLTNNTTYSFTNYAYRNICHSVY